MTTWITSLVYVKWNMSVMKFILYKTCIIKSYKQSVKHERIIYWNFILSSKVQPDLWMMWVAAQMPHLTPVARSLP